MGDAIEVQVTCGGPEEADAIADALIDTSLAACVQQVAIRSTYRWLGRIEHDDEILLLVKTTLDRYPSVEALVHELHSYDLPAISAVPIVAGSAEYLAWVAGR